LPAVDYYIPGEVKNVSCNGGADGAIAIKIDTDQDVKFEWSGPNGYSSNAQNIDGLAAGVYTVKVSYADGSCYGIMAYTVGEPRELKLDVELSYADCEGQPDGCAFVKGGTAPYRLFVFTGDIANDVDPEVVVSADGVDVEGLTPNDEMEFDESLNNDFTKYCAKNIPDGIYLILVLDANGCYVWKRVKVEAGKPLDVEVKVDHLSCHGADDGAICYSISGGTAPYKAVIVPATPIVPVEGEKGCFEGLPAGTYELIITDANGCQFLKVLEIRQADELVANFRFTSDICDEAASGCLTVKGGTKPYRIFVFTRPTVADALPEPVITDDNQATVDGMDRTDVLPYNDVVTDEFERCADNIPAGIYYVLVIDEAGCYTYVKIEIPAGGGLSIDGRVKDVSCFGGSDGEIKIDIQCGQAPYTIVWTAEDGTTFDEAVNLPAGKYKVEVKDANGCTGAARFEIRQPEELSIEFRITSPDCADQVDGCLKVSGGTPGYKIWVFTCPDNAP
ncbi:MAG: SprB repeat-containing protein, partial [Bacteroidota bacterium]